MKRLVLLLFMFGRLAYAGGPLNVAGVSGFQPGLAGTPITWNNGQVAYYTDQGDLSALLSGRQADQLIADVFARWTSVPTAAVAATRSGTLSEDVNGNNVTSINGVLSVPIDLQADSGKPVAIVYDRDGHVMDALLGSGAGTPEMCSTNSIYNAVDKIEDDAHIKHALIVINGNCATTAAQVSILRYRLTRAFGQVLGLDYSQLNENVIWGSPAPTIEDYAGFPVMHPLGVLCTESGCQANADIPRMDDRAALSRLYPVTLANQASFPAKQISGAETARISGSVRFAIWQGITGEGMQGLNVVARLVDPVTGKASRRYTASSVSGFRFRGNAGNPITGYVDVLNRRFDQWGSDDTTLQGFYDLAALEVPVGQSSATYELGVEAISPLYSDSTAVGPYKRGPVTPSGTFTPVRLTVARGGEALHDITMQGSAAEPQDRFEPNDFPSPAAVPTAGNWVGSLSLYGDRDYYSFHGKANRSFTFDVTAIDEHGAASVNKAQPVVGVWAANDVEDSPPAFEDYFNAVQTATTRLQGSFSADGEYRVGIADRRGDGRSDFGYRARLFYADDVVPSRASSSGGTTVTITGFGFAANMQVTVGSVVVPATLAGADKIAFQSPALPDATYGIVVRDPATGATSEIENALRIGAADARIILVSGSNPQVPVGTQAPNPMRISVVDLNTGDPIAGATVVVSAPAAVGIAGCSQNPCTLGTNQSGTLDIYMEVKAAGASVVTASLITGGSVQTTVNGILAALEISVANPSVNVSSGASATVPVSVVVVANGVVVQNKTVNFLLNSGNATITPASSLTDANGVATTNVSFTNLSSDVNISACIAPNNVPCRTVVIHAVSATNLVAQRVSGDMQTVKVGEAFAPLTVKVLDGAGNPVASVPVTLRVDVFRAQGGTERIQVGEVIITRREQPVVLRSFALSAVTNDSGLVTFNVGFTENQPVNVIARATAGAAQINFSLSTIWTSDGSLGSSAAAPSAFPSNLMLATKPTSTETQIQTVPVEKTKPRSRKRGSSPLWKLRRNH
jgi:hypothetical protein